MFDLYRFIVNEPIPASDSYSQHSQFSRSHRSSRRQGVFWCLTIPRAGFLPWKPPSVRWIKGQFERGASDYLHWQIVCAFNTKQSVIGVRSVFGPYHAEPTYSRGASEYVWKEDSAVLGADGLPWFRFEYGVKPIAIKEKVDWESVWENAASDQLDLIPAGIRVRSYFALRAIAARHTPAPDMVRKCHVFWGGTGLGKTRKAWFDAGPDTYSKDPRTKFWDGYTGQKHVVIDEFRGSIDISHLLRWLDRYSVRVEIKGSSVPLLASHFWITSNIEPASWYPVLDETTFGALGRRLEVIEFKEEWVPPINLSQ